MLLRPDDAPLLLLRVALLRPADAEDRLPDVLRRDELPEDDFPERDCAMMHVPL
ncbi:MAG TPA: hypothetical protein H9915_10430 [Candidatus Gemmiger faecigallinarum]|nr:hypothetical protein [Candidatus Gemmiger faecigallinarum]